MKNKGIIVGIAVVTVAAFVAASGCKGPKAEPAKKGGAPSAAAAVKKEPPKKVFAKGMGGLTVKIVDAKNRAMPVKMRAFRVTDGRSSVYMASFTSNFTRELLPGTYDIELDTIPQRIYKNITVNKEKETVENLGCITGTVNVKAMSSKNKEGRYPVKVLYPNSGILMATGMSNRPLELVAGTYEIEIGMMPKAKKSVTIEAGKEALIDLGMNMGEIFIKTVDESGKEARIAARIKKAENGETVASVVTNRPVEIVSGSYVVEAMPKGGTLLKKEVVIKPGETVTVEFIVPAPAAPVPAPVRAPVKAPAKNSTKKK